MPVAPNLSSVPLPNASTPPKINIPTYLNPATLNPATQPKIQSASSVPSVAAPEMFPKLTQALGNFGNWISGQGGFFGTPAAAAVAKPLLAAGSFLGAGQGPVVPPVVPPASNVAVTGAPKTTTTGHTVNPQTGGLMTPDQVQNANLMSQLGPGNYNINPDGSVTAKTQVAGSTTTTPTLPTIPDGSTPPPVVPPSFGGGATSLPGAPATPYDDPAYQSAVSAYQQAQQLTPEEIANNTDISNLAESSRQAYENTGNQPIPLEFITGQRKNIQESAGSLGQTLQAKAAMLEAKRTAATNASKASLDALNAKITAEKPVSVTPGNSLVNPLTGQTVATGLGGGVGGPSGTTAPGTTGNPAIDTTTAGYATQTIPSAGNLTQSAIDQAALSFALTGQLPSGSRSSSGIGGLQATAIKSRAAEMNAGGNIQGNKAKLTSLQSSLTDQTTYLNTTQRAYQTATQNFGVLSDFMTKNGLNTSGVPLINQLQNKVKAGLTDPGSVAAFQSMIEGLRAEYAQVLSRGGQVTDTSRNSASSLIPDNLSPEQLLKVKTQLDLEGGNAISAAQGQVQSINSQINGIIAPSGGGSSGGGSNSSDPYSW